MLHVLAVEHITKILLLQLDENDRYTSTCTGMYMHIMIISTLRLFKIIKASYRSANTCIAYH